jgi:hypothetical protein
LKETENRIREITEPYYYRFFLIPQAKRRQKRHIDAIRKKGRATIVFLVSSLPMWRFQTLFDRLSTDKRFDCHIAIFPFSTFSPTQQETALQQLRSYFQDRSIPLLDLSCYPSPGQVLRTDLDPDILFYPQPYNQLYGNDLDNPFFADRLICYIPYAMLTASEPWAYKCHLNNVAWRLFFPSEASKKEASAVLYNRGNNIHVVGEPMADLFGHPITHTAWKPQDKQKKKVIWAPHFSLPTDGFLHRDSFSWLSSFMLDMAKHYRDQIQFAFKPHPRLLSILYDMPDWGKDKADDYYAQWADGINTQLNTGDYVDLFKESDAMVHDSSSFTVEYHFTGKPVLFMTTDLNAVTSILNVFGKEAVMAHYQGSCPEDITSFLEDVVLGGNDPMKEKRNLFYRQFLSLPGSNSFSENIYQELVSSIWK